MRREHESIEIKKQMQMKIEVKFLEMPLSRKESSPKFNILRQKYYFIGCLPMRKVKSVLSQGRGVGTPG